MSKPVGGRGKKVENARRRSPRVAIANIEKLDQLVKLNPGKTRSDIVEELINEAAKRKGI